MGKFQFIEHTADVAIRVCGNTAEDLFEAAFRGWLKIVSGSSKIHREKQQQIQIAADSPEELLVEFLSEINFLLTARRWITGGFSQLEIKQQGSGWRLMATIFGMKLQPGVHKIKTEIKAVTFHQLEIRQQGEVLETTIVFDV
ncbi:MAG: archease [Calditrichia bacterium]